MRRRTPVLNDKHDRIWMLISATSSKYAKERSETINLSNMRMIKISHNVANVNNWRPVLRLFENSVPFYVVICFSP